jgi:hypothetical protein
VIECGTLTFTLRINGVNVGTPCVLNNLTTLTNVAGTYEVTAGDLVTVHVAGTDSNLGFFGAVRWGLR